MQILYLPQDIYAELSKNSALTPTEITQKFTVGYSTAARYKSDFKKLISKPDLYSVRHTSNRLNPIQPVNSMNTVDFDIFLLKTLDDGGFTSTEELRQLFYKHYPHLKSQSPRNFNRYFSASRLKLREQLLEHPLEIVQAKNPKVGFLTITRKKGPSDY